jgi:hypothetical protein
VTVRISTKMPILRSRQMYRKRSLFAARSAPPVAATIYSVANQAPETRMATKQAIGRVHEFPAL